MALTAALWSQRGGGLGDWVKNSKEIELQIGSYKTSRGLCKHMII